MKNLKMMMVPGIVLGMSVMVNAADAVKAPAPAAAVQPAQPATIPVAKAFDFLPDTVATVGGKAVTKAEFIAEFSKRMPNGIPAQMPIEMLKMQAPQIIEEFIAEKIVTDAVEKSGIKVTAADVAAEMRKELAGIPSEQRAMLEQQLKAQGKTVEDIIKLQSEDVNVQKQLRMMKFFESKAGKQTATLADAEKFYKENPAQFKKDAQVEASHILVKVPENATEADWAKAKAEIDAIIAELKKGADFGKLAEEKSACPSGKQAKGALGKFGKGQMVPEFEEVAFKLKKGEISSAVKTQFGYHVIKCDGGSSASEIPFAEVKDQLVAYLARQKQMQAVQKVVNDLKKAADVKVLVKAEIPANMMMPGMAPKAPAAK